jgi:WD40 repeat protein
MKWIRSIKFRYYLPVIIFSNLFFSIFVKLGYSASNQSGDYFPSEPILRVETGMHTAAITRIDVDQHERFLVSGSKDKTIRIWDLNNGRLLQTLRVPIGDGELGKIYCVSISPDGNFVAAGGQTGAKFGSTCDIYIFNRKNGSIKKVISSIPKTICHLTFSHDGSYLAATLGGRMPGPNGVHIYETKDYELVTSDLNYEAGCYWADFDPSGRLVTTSEDGYIRLYDKDFSLRLKKSVPYGKEPFSAVFSPNGENIAVGYHDFNQVVVLSAENLQQRYPNPVDTSGTNRDLLSVAWSKDGNYLYAAGKYIVADKFPIRRWTQGGIGSFTEFMVAENTVMGLKPLSNGKVAVGSADPLIAVLSTAGTPIWMHRGNIADFRDQQGAYGIRLSESGDIVQFGYGTWGKLPARFSLKTWQLELNPPEDIQLSRPYTDGLPVWDWEDTYTPKLKDQRLDLEKNEMSRSLAISQDRKRFLLGTDCYLRLFDYRGVQLGQIEAPATAWSVNISDDGRIMVAGYGDGTIRWYHFAEEKKLLVELLALFPHRDGRRWIVWTPQGFYRAAAGAEDLIGWHLNHGSKQASEFYSASRFRKQFYRPDIVSRVLDTLDVEKALALADKARCTETVFKEVKFILPPIIEILSPVENVKTESNKLTIIYKAESTTGIITDVDARIDGRPADILNKQTHSENNTSTKSIIIGQITLKLPPRDVIISLIAKNEHGSSEPAIVTSSWAGQKDWFKPDLYVLAVGVTCYEKQHLNNLEYAAKDAEDFVKAIELQKNSGLYGNFMHKLLVSTDKVKDANRNNILTQLEWLMDNTTDRDVVMVFLSGHGINDYDGKYNFLPFDGEDRRVYTNGIDSDDFRKFLSKTYGTKVFFFLDTCRSGSILLDDIKGDQMPDVDKFANELADLESGVIVFSSSTGRQDSIELKDEKNGAFTKALVEAIKGFADSKGNSDRFITIRELDAYLFDRVRELTDAKQKPRTAKPKHIKENIDDLVIIEVIQ